MTFLNRMNLVSRHVRAGLVPLARRRFVTAARDSASQASDSGLGEQVARDTVPFVRSLEHLQDLRCSGDVAAIHPQQRHQSEFLRSNHEHAAIH